MYDSAPVHAGRPAANYPFRWREIFRRRIDSRCVDKSLCCENAFGARDQTPVFRARILPLLWRRACSECIGMGHGNNIVAGIDKMNLAGDTGREVREQVKSGTTELVERHSAM
jgi:hypothetical protein